MDEQQGLVVAYAAAENELGTRWSSSLELAGKLFAGGVTIATALGGALAYLGLFTPIILVALALHCLCVFPTSFVLSELQRHRRRSVALEKVVSLRKNYEALLLDARVERETLRDQMHELRIANDVIKQIGLVRAIGAGSLSGEKDGE